MTICTPSGFEDWFRELGEPANSFDLPDQVEPFSEAVFPKMLALGKRLQTEIIQQEVRSPSTPHSPIGIGVNPRSSTAQ